MVRVVVTTAVASRLGLPEGATVAVPVAAWNCTVVVPVDRLTHPEAEVTVKVSPATALAAFRVPDDGLTVSPVPPAGATTVTPIRVTTETPAVPEKVATGLTVMVPEVPVPVAVLQVTVVAVMLTSNGLLVCADRLPAPMMSGRIAAKSLAPFVRKTFKSICGPSFS